MKFDFVVVERNNMQAKAAGYLSTLHSTINKATLIKNYKKDHFLKNISLLLEISYPNSKIVSV